MFVVRVYQSYFIFIGLLFILVDNALHCTALFIKHYFSENRKH